MGGGVPGAQAPQSAGNDISTQVMPQSGTGKYGGMANQGGGANPFQQFQQAAGQGVGNSYYPQTQQMPPGNSYYPQTQPQQQGNPGTGKFGGMANQQANQQQPFQQQGGQPNYSALLRSIAGMFGQQGGAPVNNYNPVQSANDFQLRNTYQFNPATDPSRQLADKIWAENHQRELDERAAREARAARGESYGYGMGDSTGGAGGTGEGGGGAPGDPGGPGGGPGDSGDAGLSRGGHVNPDKKIRAALLTAKGVQAKAVPGKSEGGDVAPGAARRLNDQGLYSHAAEAAAALPQAKGSPQQMLAMLSARGVKPDELKYSGAQNAFGGQKAVTKDELAQHFEQNVPEIQETVLRKNQAKYREHQLPGSGGTIDQKAKNDWLNEWAAEAAVNTDDISHAKEWKNASEEIKNWHLEEAEKAFNEKAHHDEAFINQFKSPAKKAEKYREILLHAPEKKENLNLIAQKMFGKNFVELPYEQSILVTSDPTASLGFNYTQSHWDVPNVLGHIRASDRDKGKTLHVEELQSDWGQDKRKGKGVPDHPLVGSTNAWTDLLLKRALREAASGEYDRMAWTPGEEQLKRFKNEGLVNYYDKIVPQRLTEIVKKLGHKAEITPHFIDTAEGEKSLHSIRMTPELRASIMRGLPVYKAGGRVGYAGGGGEDDPTVQKALGLTQGVQPSKSLFTQDVYHGTAGNFSEFRDDAGDYSMSRGLGVHVARDPIISSNPYFVNRDETGEGGNVLPLKTFPDNRFYEIHQPLHPYLPEETPKAPRTVRDDDVSVENEIMSHAFKHDKDLLKMTLMEQRQLSEADANEAVNKLHSGQPWVHHGQEVKNIDHLVKNYGLQPWSEHARKYAVKSFRDEIIKRGYVGVKYINTSPNETENAKDPTCYIVFPEKGREGMYPLRGRFAKFDPARAHEADIMSARGGGIGYANGGGNNSVVRRALDLTKGIN